MNVMKKIAEILLFNKNTLKKMKLIDSMRDDLLSSQFSGP